MTPAEILNFLTDVVVYVDALPMYNFFVAIANCLQAINFSFNFLLYISINASFRHAARGLICQSPERELKYESMTALTQVKTSVRGSVSVGANGSLSLKGTPALSAKQGIALLSTTTV